jgi:hypothetical protein
MHVVYRAAGGAGNSFHFGRGGSWYDHSPCDRIPSLLALTPYSLDNFDCRFLARSNHIRVGQRNPRSTTPDTSSQVSFSTPSPITTVAFWSGSACKMATNSWTVIAPTVVAGGHTSKASTVSTTGTKPRTNTPTRKSTSLIMGRS